MTLPNPTHPEWYSQELAAEDRAHDGVGWRCRDHGLLSAQFVLILGHVAYCGACVTGDGQAAPLPLVAQPHVRAYDAKDTDAKRPRRPPVEPRTGTRMSAVLSQIRRASPPGIRHLDVVQRWGPTANPAIRDLSRRGLIVRVDVGVWRAVVTR